MYWIAGVFGLAGVLVGGFVQWLLTSAGEKRRARQEARVAARLLLEHFRIAKRTLEGMNKTGWTKGRPDVLFFGNLWDSCSRPLANGIVPIDDYRLVHETVVYLLIIESLQLEGKIPEGTPVKDLPEHLDIGIPGVSKNIGKVEKILSVVAKEERRLRKPWAYLSSLPDRLIYRRGQTG